MDAIKIEVIGNIAKVLEKPKRITSGTVGLPVEFTFDDQWVGLTKVAVFRAGNVTKTKELPGTTDVVPWEVLVNAGPWLSIGVQGSSADGTLVIPTIWANVAPVYLGADPDGDPAAEPSPTLWKQIKMAIDATNDRIDELVVGSVPPPDWDQNDPAKPGYIKNKPSVVEYTSQNLSAVQKAQARENIGAASADDIGNISAALDSIIAIQESIIGGGSV